MGNELESAGWRSAAKSWRQTLLQSEDIRTHNKIEHATQENAHDMGLT